MPIIFEKLLIDVLAAISGNKGFRRLTTEKPDTEPGIFDLMGLTPGTYEITVKSIAPNLEPSDMSEPLIIEIK